MKRFSITYAFRPDERPEIERYLREGGMNLEDNRVFDPSESNIIGGYFSPKDVMTNLEFLTVPTDTALSRLLDEKVHTQ